MKYIFHQTVVSDVILFSKWARQIGYFRNYPSDHYYFMPTFNFKGIEILQFNAFLSNFGNSSSLDHHGDSWGFLIINNVKLIQKYVHNFIY